MVTSWPVEPFCEYTVMKCLPGQSSALIRQEKGFSSVQVLMGRECKWPDDGLLAGAQCTYYLMREELLMLPSAECTTGRTVVQANCKVM